MVYTQSEQDELNDAAEGFYSRFAMKELLPDEYRKHYPAPVPLALPNNAAAMQALIDALPPLPCFISEPETEHTEEVLAAEMNGELGSLPVSSSEPLSTSAFDDSFDSRYSAPPPDRKKSTAPGVEQLNTIQDCWEKCLADMKQIPTKSGTPANFVDPWLPWEAAENPGFELFLCVLNYCPISVWNFCSVRKGGHMSL